MQSLLDLEGILKIVLIPQRKECRAMLLPPQRRKLEDKVEPKSYSATMLIIQPRNKLNLIANLGQFNFFVSGLVLY